MSERSVSVARALFLAHAWCALGMLAYVGLLGVVLAMRLHHPDFLAEHEWLSWGRLRYAHTQGVFFGWLGNAFLAFLYYAVPRVAGRPVTSIGLGWLLWALWNLGVVLPGWVLVQVGISQALEWAEFPLPIDVLATLALFLALVQFGFPLLRSPLSSLYVSGWYILGGLTFTLLAYPVGNIVPEFEAGTKGAAYSGLWIHDAIGLYVTPLALAVAYLLIPEITGRPIYSHFLSLVGFWLLFLVYPLNGTHHYVFSSIPMEAQKGAIVASVYLGVDVLIVVTNLLLSMRGGVRGQGDSLRWVWVGVIAYLLVSMQGASQALMPVNRFVHFSDWVIGHAHLALIGFASFLALGGILHVWQRLPGLRYNVVAAAWAFWLFVLALAIMVLSLTAAGLVQGHLWQSEATWLESIKASQVYWFIRTISGFLLLGGLLAFVLALTTGRRTDGVPIPVAESEPTPLVWLQSGYVILAVAGVGFFALSFLALAVLPGRQLDAEIAASAPPVRQPIYRAEERGRAIYLREGCGYCHTQLVRSTLDDVRRFGLVSEAWESARDLPQQWGTRRIGPDLAREHGKRSEDWHLAHLRNPRWVVPGSNMPAYPWLSAEEARDLVAYLDSLGRERDSLRQVEQMPGRSPEEEKRLGMFCDCAIPRTAGPPVLLDTRLRLGEKARFGRRGAEVFTEHCSGCHGAQGKSDGPASDLLMPRPRDLTQVRYSDRALSEILWQGVRGSSMPAWHTLPIGELRALAVYVRGIGPEPEPVQPEEKGAALFAKHCASCHAGLASTVLAPPAPRFDRIQPGRAFALAVLEKGIPGTSMAPWLAGTPAERELVVAYLRSLYREE